MTSPRRARRVPALATALLLSLLLAACTSPSAPDELTPSSSHAAAAAVNGRHVVAISVDGLNPRALATLGRTGAPYFHQLMANGAFTLNARSQVEQTVTLPNHTSMVTGRRITASAGGHGVTWNTDRTSMTVHEAAGHDVSSVFRTVRAGGGRTAVFSTKAKFAIFDRSWPTAVHRSVIRVEDDATVTRDMRRDLVSNRRSFTFLHLGLADQVGHEKGWMGPAYLQAVRRLDGLIGSVLTTIRNDAGLRRSTVVVLTADHGGRPGTHDHSLATSYENYRVPFMLWGAGVVHGNLYRMNATFADPGTDRPGFTGTQPIRNGDVANLVTDLLGLGPVPGSLWNRQQALTWR